MARKAAGTSLRSGQGQGLVCRADSLALAALRCREIPGLPAWLGASCVQSPVVTTQGDPVKAGDVLLMGLKGLTEEGGAP